MTLSVYTQLKRQIVHSVAAAAGAGHSHTIATLKDIFRSQINSPRRYEQINSIRQLLDVLEIREVLSENNVQPLKDIAAKLSNRNELLNKISEYETAHVPRQYVNYYDEKQQISPVIQQSPTPTITTNPLGGTISIKKRQRIMETIVEGIGTFWKTFARYLNIRECVIDEIDGQNKTIAKKASKIMKIYEERANPQSWYFDLREALDNARRNDLNRDLDKIMAMNI